MPRGSPAPGSAEDWLSRASGDLALARAPLPAGGFYEDLCFHAQQAAEKALKAVYVHHEWTFRYVHNLAVLIVGLERNGLEIPTEISAAIVLTAYAEASRYPGLSEPVTEGERELAVAQATAVVEWAESIIGRS